MLVLVDRTLAAAGLDFQTAVALLEPAEGELVIHIRQELDDAAPTAPPPDVDDGVLSTVTAGDATDSKSAAQPQAEEPSVYTAPSSDVDFRGFDFRAAEAEAKSQRLELVMVGGVYTLQSVLGQRHYQTLADVMQALRLRRF